MSSRFATQISRAAALMSAALLTGVFLSSQVAAGAGVAAGIGLFALALCARVGGRAGPPSDDLERQLAWFRRRGEPTAVVIAMTANRADLELMRRELRTTDYVAVRRGRMGHELHAVLDHSVEERLWLEHRLARVAGSPVHFGWARFPDEGLTLDALLQHARSALGAVSPAPAAEPVSERPAVPVLTGKTIHQTGGA